MTLYLSFRITSLTNQWSKDVKMEPATGVELELTLDTSGARAALHDLHFIELKGLFTAKYSTLKYTRGTVEQL